VNAHAERIRKRLLYGQDLSEQVCLVTGASGGIGKVMAREIARQGMQVLVISRNEARCAAAVAEIREATANQQVDYLVADLSSQEQVRELARRFRQQYKRLDVLINNAGGFFMKRLLSEDGIEMTWALNHLSYFLLTNLLSDMLADSSPARVINVSSNAHLSGSINFNDLEGKRFFFGWRAYAQSKLANILFTFELARCLEGSGVTANAMHPGYVATGFGLNNAGPVGFFIRLSHIFAISPEEGAKTGVFLATSPELEGVTGKYFVKQKPVPAAKAAYDQEAARRLWKLSAHRTGLNRSKP
jgi:retinol dehydrogenase 12